MAGLTEQGFTVKTQNEIKENIIRRLESYFGTTLNTQVGSRFGTLIDIFSYELADAWLGIQSDYNSRFRNGATFNNLDNVGSLTNSLRKTPLNGTGQIYLFGSDSSLIIPSGVTFTSPGNDNIEFSLDSEASLSPDHILVVCDRFSTNGNLVLSYTGAADITIPFDSTVIGIVNIIATSLNDTFGGVTTNDIQVTLRDSLGSLATDRAFLITLVNNPGVVEISVHPDTDLISRAVAVNAQVGFSTAVTESITSTEALGISVNSYGIDTITTPIPGWIGITNFNATEPGQTRELDSAYRARIREDLAAMGKATLGGFRQILENLNNVQSVTIVENVTNEFVAGRPPNTFECYIDGGNNDQIAQAIYDNKPVGIRNVSTLTLTQGSSQREGNIVDVNGVPRTVKFSSSVTSNIFIQVSYSKNVNFSSEGEDQIKNAILTYLENQQIGQSIQTYKLYAPIVSIPGVVTAKILIGTDSVLLSEDNITARPFEILSSTAEFITVTLITE